MTGFSKTGDGGHSRLFTKSATGRAMELSIPRVRRVRVADVDRHGRVRRRENGTVNVQFIASVSLIASDAFTSRKLYVDAIGLPLEKADGDYYASEAVGGCKHFGVWPLAQAAEACFGTSEWPADRPVPQVSIEFEVQDVGAVADAAAELERYGHSLLHPPRTEPWGQTIARILSPEGAIIGVSYAPWLHDGPAG